MATGATPSARAASPRSPSPRAPSPRARLVLVHGTRVSHVQWDLHRRWLEPQFEVATPDLPGHGSMAKVPFTMDRAVAAVADAVDGGSTGLPVVLVGHSLGGYVAMEYAARHPRRLAGLVLIGSTAVPTGPGAAAYRLIGRATERAGRERVSRFNDRVLTRMVPPALFSAIAADGYWFGSVGAAWDAVMASGRPELLGGVECPVLIVRGQYDQLGIHARRYAAAARRARVRTVRGASHLLPLTRPEQTSGIIASFAAEVTAWGDPPTIRARSSVE